MREIKFRGIPFDWNQFIYGNYVEYQGTHYIYTEMYEKATHLDILSQVQIDKSTLGQVTGLLDKSSKEIYEGDIVLGNDSTYPHEIIFHHGRFKENNSGLLFSTTWEIIGNIYENPELLKENSDVSNT